MGRPQTAPGPPLGADREPRPPEGAAPSGRRQLGRLPARTAARARRRPHHRSVSVRLQVPAAQWGVLQAGPQARGRGPGRLGAGPSAPPNGSELGPPARPGAHCKTPGEGERPSPASGASSPEPHPRGLALLEMGCGRASGLPGACGPRQRSHAPASRAPCAESTFGHPPPCEDSGRAGRCSQHGKRPGPRPLVCELPSPPAGKQGPAGGWASFLLRSGRSFGRSSHCRPGGASGILEMGES
nr:skin secretory protein xP2-like [Equus asinus]